MNKLWKLILFSFFTFTNGSPPILITSMLLPWIPVAYSCPKRSPSKPKLVIPEKVFIAAPKSLRLDMIERIAVISTDSEKLNIYIKDHPGQTRTFFSTSVVIEKGVPQFVNVHVSSYALQHTDLKDRKTKFYVSLVVESSKFNKKFKLHLDYSKTGFVFLQTDKPIYHPEQNVNIRIIPVNEKLLPKNSEVRVQIKNPQRIVVYDKIFSQPWKNQITQFPSLTFTFPPFPQFGKWSVIAFYGYNQNTTVSFYVEEYVLPTFKVQLETPNVILPTDNQIIVKVLAEYHFRKKVNGIVMVKLSIQKTPETIIEVINVNKSIDDGIATILFDIEEILRHPKVVTFPYNSSLIANVSVVDSATGNTANAVDSQCKFQKFPYLVSFKDTLRDFRPGIVSTIIADVTFANGKPAANIPVFISVKDSNFKELKISESKRITDKNGRVIFYVNPPYGHDGIIVMVRTADALYPLYLQRYTSSSYIAISRTEATKKLKIGETFTASIYSHQNSKLDNFFFLVMARGQILLLKNIPNDERQQRQIEFIVTAEMAPILRVVVLCLQDNKQLLLDSLRLYVENKCEPKSEVALSLDFPEIQPGRRGKFIIKGEPKTKVGVLAIDKAVYAMKNQEKLTREKLFENLASRDSGNGPGGGTTLQSVLSNAGLVLFIIYEKEKENDDTEKKIFFDTIQLNVMTIKVGMESFPNNFDIESDYSDDGFDVMKFDYDDIHLDHNDIDESQEDDETPRSDFSETWLFNDLEIESNGTAVINTKLPDSITTWVIQTISVSNRWGMCISLPEEIVSFKNIFLHLSIPYSVVRKEQVEIKATIFNYYPRKIPVTVYMYGVEHLCSGTEAGQKSERKRIQIEANSAIKVNFPVVPLKVKKYPLRVVALSPFGSDVVVKILNVVPEGIIEEEDIVVTLDPANMQKRKRRHVVTEYFSDFINDSQNLQITKIYLLPSKKYIPGTEKALISAIGTEYGPTVESVLLDPKHLIRMPTGCCEQTMTYMGPTLYTLHFLKSKGKIAVDTEEKLYDYVREGYKRGLTFRKTDGSYALWPHRSSSTWLTAFVMKMFSQARKYIFIDKTVIRNGILWLLSRQNLDGSFHDLRPIVRRDIMTGESGIVPMTAFVAIALEESAWTSTDDKKDEFYIARLNAKSFLEREYMLINDSYTMALTAYALALSDSQIKHNASQRLLQMSTFDEELNRRYWERKSISESVETTAYALLTQLKLNDLRSSLSIVNWMNTQRLHGGGFQSSQTTVIALQALSEYSIKIKSTDTSLICNVTSNLDQSFEKTISFQDSNALMLQQFQVKELGETLSFHTSGKGVGLLSVKMRYNVIPEMKNPCKFDVKVNVSEVTEKIRFPVSICNGSIDNEEDCRENEADKVDSTYFTNTSKSDNEYILKVNICIRFLSNKVSEMAIVEAGIFSGFNPMKQDLDELLSDHNNPIDRYEIAERKIIFYLDQVSHEKPSCILFRIRRNYIVGNTQASVIKVYDYYNNDKACTITYSPDSDSDLVKEVCEDLVCRCASGIDLTSRVNIPDAA